MKVLRLHRIKHTDFLHCVFAVIYVPKNTAMMHFFSSLPITCVLYVWLNSFLKTHDRGTE